MERPAGAWVLFDGSDLRHWTHRRSGEPARWTVADGVMTVLAGSGDIVSEQTYRDAWIHLEWREPDMPEATGQKKGNSGVYIQGRYEIQVLDSYGWQVPGKGDCGAVYDVCAPLVNACRPAMQWQTYDIVFRAARTAPDGTVTEHARLTVWQNGQVIHNNVELPGPTGGALSGDEGQPGPLLLQDHRDAVSYRNIWVQPLPEKGSEDYAPH